MVFVMSRSAGYAAAASGFLTQKPGDILTVSTPGFLNGLTALANATVNGFPMIMIAAPATARSSTYQQGDYEELDRMKYGETSMPKQHFALISQQDLGIALARAIRVSVWVALAEFILICQQMSWPRRWKRRSVNHDC
ncbi:thiamine pyrophosphate-binding protein [Escherichia coli]